MSDERQAALTIRMDEPEMSVEAITSRVRKIEEIREKIMKVDVHFGKIPGVDKPCLLKPGAEILCMTFRAVPRYTEKQIDMPNGHVQIKMLCELYHHDGAYIGSGVGSCSSMESKYRWRRKDVGTEVGPVPKAYWEAPRDNFPARMATLAAAYGPGKYKTKKSGGEWVVLRLEGDGEKEENPDIADVYNTVLKMAKKRAFIDATITAFSVSDSFTQDVEEEHEGKGVPEDGNGRHESGQSAKPKPASALRKQIGRLVMDEKNGFSIEAQEAARVFCDKNESNDDAMRAELERLTQLSAGARETRAKLDAEADVGFNQAAGK